MIADLKAEREQAEKFLLALDPVIEIALIGSATFMPDEANDVDYAVLVRGDPYRFAEKHLEGFTPCGEDESYGDWCSMRRGVLNVMVTSDETWYRNYVQAMHVCAFLKLRNKDDRIAVCKIVRDEMTAEQARAWVEEKNSL